MDPLREKRFDRIKLFLVSLFCSLGVAGSIFMLWKDFNESGTAGQGPAMAKVLRREAKVRRKAKSSFVWSNVQTNEDLYKRDSIQTAESSAASIKLKDGSVLEMGSNSLIVIDDLGQLNLDYLRGQMTLRNASGESSVLTVGADGKAKLELLPIQIVKPDPLAYFFTTTATPVNVALTWKLSQTATAKLPSKIYAQVSTDMNFRKDKTKDFALEATSEVLEYTAEPNRYFWRFVGGEEGGTMQVLSATGRFQVLAAEPLRAVYPNSSENAVSWGTESSVQFRWVAPKNFEAADDQSNLLEHRVIVAKDPGFTQIVVAEKISAMAESALIKGLPLGSYYWRMFSRFGQIKVVSKTEHFKIDRQEKLAFETVTPEENGAIALKGPVRFIWQSDARDLDYVLELQTADQKPVLTNKTKSLGLEWRGATDGSYRWRVAAVSGDRRVGETAWRNFMIYRGEPIALIAPANGKELYYWDEPQGFVFKWAKPEDVEKPRYQLEISKDQNFKTVALRATAMSNAASSDKLRLKPGTYFWRVRQIDAANKIIRGSEVRKVAYGPYPALRAPAAARPEPGFVFNLLEENVKVAADWTPVEGAEKYEITVTPQGSEKPVLQTISKDTEIEMHGLRAGKYDWTVRSVDKLGRKGEPMPVRNFTIGYGDKLPPPEIISPEVQ